MILTYLSELGLKDVNYTCAYGCENIYFILHQKYVSNQEYKTSTETNEYHYLDKKDVELKGDVDNEGIIEYGNDFINRKIIQDRASTYLYESTFLKMLS